MRKLNKKGFTLVEIIGVVAILGILSVVGIISVNSIIAKGKQEHYKTAEKTLKMSAESYAQANRNYLPKNVGEKKIITLKQLVEDNYIEQIQDYNDRNCDLENSYVQIFKYSKTDYSYLTYLNCPDYSNVESNNELKPSISISMTAPNDNRVKKTTADVSIDDSSKILSYSITIYKNENEIFTTGNVEANYATDIDKTHDISKYTPGTIKVVVKATNIYGNSTTKKEEKTYLDKQGPECIVKTEDTTRDNDDWTTGTRKITVGCDDGEEGSGCARETFTKTFKTDAEKGYITIKDKAGNETKCEVDVFIDKTKPTCFVQEKGTKGLNDWYITDAKVELSPGDVLSGVKYTSLTTSATAPTSASGYNGLIENTQSDITTVKWYGYVEDYAGNKTSCSTSNFKVDTTAPTIPSGGSIVVSGSSETAELGAVSGSADATAGLWEYRYYVVKNSSTQPDKTSSNFKTSRTFTRACGTTYYAYAIAVDNAGNISNVYRIGTAADGANQYSSWGACTKLCGGGTQTRTNTCALVTTNLSQSCNTMGCCDSVEYENGSSCSKTCGGGTYNRIAYSAYDGSRCSGKDKSSGGSSCNTQDCCSSTYTEWDSWGSCSASCGTGTKKRSGSKYSYYDDSYCGTASDSKSCDAGSCAPPPHSHDWNCRDTQSPYSMGFKWDCTAGHKDHTTGFHITCCVCGIDKDFSATLWCPYNTTPKVFTG